MSSMISVLDTTSEFCTYQRRHHCMRMNEKSAANFKPAFSHHTILASQFAQAPSFAIF